MTKRGCFRMKHKTLLLPMILFGLLLLTGCSTPCEYADCDTIAEGSRYCVLHTCKEDGCKNPVVEKFSDYCEEHIPCAVEGCLEKPVDEDIYCQIHKAEMEVKKEADRKKALAKLNSTYDKFKEVTWYEPQCKPEYINRNAFYLYMGESNSETTKGHTWLRWKIVYSDDEWVFFDEIIINVDGENYTKSFDYLDVERDNNGSGVWEYVDILLEDEDIPLLKAIANSQKTSIRFQGDQYRYDREITQNEKYGIMDVLNAYELSQD